MDCDNTQSLQAQIFQTSMQNLQKIPLIYYTQTDVAFKQNYTEQIKSATLAQNFYKYISDLSYYQKMFTVRRLRNTTHGQSMHFSHTSARGLPHGCIRTT